MKSKVRKKVTPFAIAVHEFHDHFRRLPEGVTYFDIFKLLSERREESLKTFSKSLGLSVLLFLTLSASGFGSDISIETQFVTLSIPKIYIVFLISISNLMGIMELLSVLLLQQFQSVISRRFARSFANTTLLSAPHNANGAWGMIFHQRYKFLRPERSYMFGVALAIAVTLAPLLLVYIAIAAMQIVQLFWFFSYPSTVFFGGIIAWISLFAMISPITLVWLSIRPVSLFKNTQFIRWVFLQRVHRALSYPAKHPTHWSATSHPRGTTKGDPLS